MPAFAADEWIQTILQVLPSLAYKDPAGSDLGKAVTSGHFKGFARVVTFLHVLKSYKVI